MNRNILLFAALLLLTVEISFGQQLTPFVVSSSGGYVANASGSLSFTTGEMTTVETYTAAANILTQGFQQPWDFGTYVIEHPGAEFSFNIYPNPSDGKLTMLTESELETDMIINVTDLLGRNVLHADFEHRIPVQSQTLDLAHAAPGIYFLTIAIQTVNSSIESMQTVKLEIIR